MRPATPARALAICPSLVICAPSAGRSGLERPQRPEHGGSTGMSIEVETKDCTGLSDVELAELADLCAESPFPHEIGDHHQGSPSPGCWSPRRATTASSRASRSPPSSASAARRACSSAWAPSSSRQARHGPAGDHARGAAPGRAGLPRRGRPGGGPPHGPVRLRGVPRPVRPGAAHRAQGLRRGAGLGSPPGQAFRHRARRLRRPPPSGSRATVRCRSSFDHECLKRDEVADHVEFFADLDAGSGECVIAFGWAMAEELDKLA